MRSRSEILRNPRVSSLHKSLGFDACEVRTHQGIVYVLFGDDEEGWEHVSVSPAGSKDERVQPCPTWPQMCEVKSIFWRPTESVVQFHPAKGNYLHGVCGINTNILHMWRPKDGDWSILNDEETA